MEKRLEIRLSNELKLKLELFCKKRNLKMADVVRKAISDYIHYNSLEKWSEKRKF